MVLLMILIYLCGRGPGIPNGTYQPIASAPTTPPPPKPKG